MVVRHIDLGDLCARAVTGASAMRTQFCPHVVVDVLCSRLHITSPNG